MRSDVLASLPIPAGKPVPRSPDPYDSGHGSSPRDQLVPTVNGDSSSSSNGFFSDMVDSLDFQATISVENDDLYKPGFARTQVSGASDDMDFDFECASRAPSGNMSVIGDICDKYLGGESELSILDYGDEPSFSDIFKDLLPEPKLPSPIIIPQFPVRLAPQQQPITVTAPGRIASTAGLLPPPQQRDIKTQPASSPLYGKIDWPSLNELKLEGVCESPTLPPTLPTPPSSAREATKGVNCSSEFLCPVHSCVHPTARRVSCDSASSLGDDIQTVPSNSNRSRPKTSRANVRSKAVSTKASRAKRHHEKFESFALECLGSATAQEVMGVLRKSSAWTAAVTYAESRDGGNCDRQFQVSNTNKVFTGMYKLVNDRQYRKYTFKEGYQPQMIHWSDTDCCWYMGLPTDDQPFTPYFKNLCNDATVPIDGWTQVHDNCGSLPTIELLIGNSRKSKEFCKACNTRESYHTVYYGPQENTKPSCDHGSGEAPASGLRSSPQRNTNFCEACGQSASNHTVYLGSDVNGGGIGLAIFKLFPPCAARSNWRFSINVDVGFTSMPSVGVKSEASTSLVSTNSSNKVVQGSSSRSGGRKRGAAEVEGEDLQVYNALSKLIAARGHEHVRHKIDALFDPNAEASTKRIKIENGFECGMREEGSIIVRFAASIKADGWWPASNFERWIEQAATIYLAKASTIKLISVMATISGSATAVKLNLKLKFDGDFRSQADHDKITQLRIPSLLQRWMDRAVKIFKYHDLALGEIVGAMSNQIGRNRLNEIFHAAAQNVLPQGASFTVGDLTEARRETSDAPPVYGEVFESPPQYIIPLVAEDADVLMNTTENDGAEKQVDENVRTVLPGIKAPAAELKDGDELHEWLVDESVVSPITPISKERAKEVAKEAAATVSTRKSEVRKSVSPKKIQKKKKRMLAS